MTDDQGQIALRALASELIERLQGCQGALHHLGGTEHLQHREFAQRARLLAMPLRQAVRAASSFDYPSAFDLLRTALEHGVFDRLLFLASLHEQDVEGVTEDVWANWQQTGLPQYAERWARLSRDRVRITWQGPRVVDDQGRTLHTLSIYYRWWKDYDPFAVPVRQFDEIAAGHPSRKAEMADYTRMQRELWQNALVWKNLKANLVLNRLATEREMLQLDVHYRFLSAFVHPFSEHVTDSVYRQRTHGDWPTEEHYAEELVLLYVCAFAIEELRAFERMTKREPRVALTNWDAVDRQLMLADAQIAHLWPPGRAPFVYDRIHEANQRAFDAMDAQHAAGEPLTRPQPTDPRSLRDEDIRYYADPLHRLVRLHQSSTEMMTGLSWISPWPRADAQYR